MALPNMPNIVRNTMILRIHVRDCGIGKEACLSCMNASFMSIIKEKEIIADTDSELCDKGCGHTRNRHYVTVEKLEDGNDEDSTFHGECLEEDCACIY